MMGDDDDGCGFSDDLMTMVLANMGALWVRPQLRSCWQAQVGGGQQIEHSDR